MSTETLQRCHSLWGMTFESGTNIGSQLCGAKNTPKAAISEENHQISLKNTFFPFTTKNKTEQKLKSMDLLQLRSSKGTLKGLGHTVLTMENKANKGEKSKY